MPDMRDDKSWEQVEMDRLSRRLGKYTLVSAVAKRAKDLKERVSRSAGGKETGSIILQALQEIADGKVRLVRRQEGSEDVEQEVRSPARRPKRTAATKTTRRKGSTRSSRER